MKYRKVIFTLGAVSLLSGCISKEVKIKEKSIEEGGFYYNNIYFGANFPEIYKKGIVDGCTTAGGNYKKSHKDFKTNINYENGWFLGRNLCNVSTVEEKKSFTGIFKER